MWNKKAWLLLIRVRANRVRLLLPLSLGVLEEALQAVTDLVDVFSPLVRLPGGLRLHHMTRAARQLVSGIRSYPRWRLVEVDTDEARVKIDLY